MYLFSLYFKLLCCETRSAFLFFLLQLRLCVELHVLRIFVLGEVPVAERTSYIWRVNYFDCWSRLIFSPNEDDLSHSARIFPVQLKDGERAPNYLFLKIFRAGRAYFCPLPDQQQLTTMRIEPSGSWTLWVYPFRPGVPSCKWTRRINSPSDNSATFLETFILLFNTKLDYASWLNIPFLIYRLIQGSLVLHF